MIAHTESPANLRITEKTVARLWEQQGPFTLPLHTTEGEEIQVVYRGRRRWDRGPDFTGALIAGAGASLHHGEVEIHVRASDWCAHGHHRDPNYNQVILQVVLWNDTGRLARRQDGVTIPTLALAPYLALPLETLAGLGPDQISRPSPRRPDIGGDEVGLGNLLDGCGVERFEAKSRRFESDLTCYPHEQLLYQAVAEALGYSQNRQPFRRLADLVPLDLARAFEGRLGGTEARGRGEMGGDGKTGIEAGGVRWRDAAVEALLLGAAGLLPSQRGMAPVDSYADRLELLWDKVARHWVGGCMAPDEWEFFRVRPANFPTRRVAALAMLVRRWPEESLAEVLARTVGTLQPRLVPRALEALLLDNLCRGYWDSYCDFGLRLRRPVGLIGRQRAAELAVNVFLPFLAGWASHLEDRALAGRAFEIYRLYPKRGDNEIVRYMATQITGKPRPAAARSACRQLGLLRLYRAYCEAKSCAACPGGDICASKPLTIGITCPVPAKS
ncbi:MAG: DUF2851 family protein [Chloroflexota bacterium]